MVGLGAFALAFGFWISAEADAPYTVRIHLQTDRPAYVVGQAIRIRFVLTTETTLPYWQGYTPALKIVNAQKAILPNRGVDNPWGSIGPGRREELQPGNTTLESYDWRGARVFRQWFDLGNLGYHLAGPKNTRSSGTERLKIIACDPRRP